MNKENANSTLRLCILFALCETDLGKNIDFKNIHMFSARPSRRATNRRQSTKSGVQGSRVGFRQQKFSVSSEKESSGAEVMSTDNQRVGSDFIQRKCAECEKEEKGKIYLSQYRSSSSFIQTKDAAVPVSKPITEAIHSSKGSGT